MSNNCPKCGSLFTVVDTGGKLHCTMCGYDESRGDSNHETASSSINSNRIIGWICPKCERSISPYISVCPCTDDREYTITSQPSLQQFINK